MLRVSSVFLEAQTANLRRFNLSRRARFARWWLCFIVSRTVAPLRLRLLLCQFIFFPTLDGAVAISTQPHDFRRLIVVKMVHLRIGIIADSAREFYYLSGLEPVVSQPPRLGLFSLKLVQ